jgi:CheY-like chemotaxis protein
MNFTFRHWNRLKYPTKHILVVEDVIVQQKRILDHFNEIFEPEGIVQISVVAGALAAAGILNHCKIDLIILDHDLPEGNGTDLLNWMKQHNVNIPVITFSGIPANNAHMGSLGASHAYFGKEDVISGRADKLINVLLELNSGVAEDYINECSPNKPVIQRYWVTPKILVGGNINNQNDWYHLEKTYGIKAVINIETSEATRGINIPNLCEFYADDNGEHFVKERVHEVVKFAEKNSHHPIYIHCHLGMSRSTHFTYAILRHNYKLSPEDALAKIKQALPTERHHWGFNQHTQAYVESIENALKELI